MLKKIKEFRRLKKDFAILQRQNDYLYFEVSKLYELLDKKDLEINEKEKNIERELKRKEKEIERMQSELNKYKKVEKLKKQNYTHKVVFKENAYKTRYVTEEQFNEIKQVLSTTNNELYVDVAGELFKIKDIEIVTTLENKGVQNG